MVPNVKTAAEARKVVQCVKYAPEGNRGCIFGDAHTDFNTVQPAEFMARSNENTTVLCQIESVEGLANLNEIAAISGVDVLWIGQFDLTQSLGIPGQFQHEKFVTAIKRVVAAAQRRKLCVAMQPDNLAQAQEWLKLGINVLSYSGDFYVYQQALSQEVKDIRALTKARVGQQSNEDSNH
jgi:2-dehydro-3-deoxyglucarate aldolase/4-hydroxy-2-oxoheptanedioate aldolase